MKKSSILLLASLLSGCPGAQAPCTTMPDLCALQAFKADAPKTVNQAVVEVSVVKDQIIRSAAVTHWLQTHPGVTPAEAVRLCALLAPDAQRSCSRRAVSSHLNR